MSGIITSEKQRYYIRVSSTKNSITGVVFYSGWQMICYLSNINV